MKRLVLALTALTLVLAGCGGASNVITVRASFEDVSDLAASAPVMLADIRVGTVKSIQLADNRALITMQIDKAARVPRDVIARARRTSLLGERIIDLEIPPNLPPGEPLLRDKDMISRTVVRPDLEDLVQEGSQVLGDIPASEIATLIDEGAKGFGKSGPELRSLLKSFNKIVGSFSKETGTIQSILESANQLNTTVAAKATEQGLAVQNTARALQVLREESDRLIAAVKALNRLAVGGASLMRAHFNSMLRFFPEMRSILGSIASEQKALVAFLYWNLLHNRNTQMVEFGQFNQILQDFVFCGHNGGTGPNENPNEEARSCNPGPGH
jgi:phospholipid/cholesterol/gamma-HCH transport system substrate-binding protein